MFKEEYKSLCKAVVTIAPGFNPRARAIFSTRIKQSLLVGHHAAAESDQHVPEMAGHLAQRPAKPAASAPAESAAPVLLETVKHIIKMLKLNDALNRF